MLIDGAFSSLPAGVAEGRRILANIRRRQFKTPWLNSVTGVLIGAPLGVCVNCATPIAFGIYSAGARLETALASLFASPTLNVIVLTMAFTLLPWEIAAAKTLGVVLLITCIPFLVRRFAGAPDLQAANAVAADSSPRLPALGGGAAYADLRLRRRRGPAGRPDG